MGLVLGYLGIVYYLMIHTRSIFLIICSSDGVPDQISNTFGRGESGLMSKTSQDGLLNVFLSKKY